MPERAINISSINRMKLGKSRPHNFTIKFDPVVHLDTEMNHELAVDRVSMTYSWHNINADYGNKTIKYSKDNGSTWKNITFVDGMYSYDDISDYINQVIIDNDDEPSNNRIGVKIYFVLTSYRVVVELGNQWQLDIRNSTFGELIGSALLLYVLNVHLKRFNSQHSLEFKQLVAVTLVRENSLTY